MGPNERMNIKVSLIQYNPILSINTSYCIFIKTIRKNRKILYQKATSISANKMTHLQQCLWLTLPSVFKEEMLTFPTNLLMDDRLNIDLLNGNMKPNSLSNSLCSEIDFQKQHLSSAS